MKSIVRIVLTAFLIFVASNAYAVPGLQIYIEGSNYDATTQTWTITSPTFNLWVLGSAGVSEDPDKPGEFVANGYPIFDVKLSAAVSGSENGTITLTPTTATTPTGFIGDFDTSTPDPATATNQPPATFETQPQLGNGKELPPHDVYGKDSGNSWFEWNLGDFTAFDSPVNDLITSFPNPYVVGQMGQINAYQVTVTGFSWVHFDTYNHWVKNNGDYKHIFAPFSHDGEGGGGGGGGGGEQEVPEPATLLLLGSGLVGLGLVRRRKAWR